MEANLIYALNEQDKLVNINDVLNGRACNCRCPKCKQPVIARQGKHNVYHFSHETGCNCVGSVESVIHLLAKAVLLRTKCIQLPAKVEGEKGELMHFEVVIRETRDEKTGLTPDIIGFYGERCIWVEFKHTHSVDDYKRSTIIAEGIECVEVDLKDLQQDPDVIQDFLEKSDANREWVRKVEYSQPHSSNSNKLLGRVKTENINKYYRFSLFEDGKYIVDKIPMSNVNKHLPNTKYELIYKDSSLNEYEAEKISLVQCYREGLRSSYCKICSKLFNGGDYLRTKDDARCRLYKCKVCEMKMDCKYFKLMEPFKKIFFDGIDKNNVIVYEKKTPNAEPDLFDVLN